MEAVAAAQRHASSCVTALSHRLMKHLCAANNYPNDGASRASNLVFSPLSIYSALSLMATCTRGSTLSELLDVLGQRCGVGLADSAVLQFHRALAGANHRCGPEIAYACALWHDATRKMKPAYRDFYWLGAMDAVDFLNSEEEARKHINSWVAWKTDGCVDSILVPGSVGKNSTRLVHTSAFYFRGRWERTFYQWRNEEHRFHRLDGSAVDGQFMHSYQDQFVATHDGFKVLKMPYTLHDPFDGMPPSEMMELVREGRMRPPLFPRYSMCVFLPDARDGLWSLEDKMMVSSPDFIREHLPEKRIKVGEFWVPKFRLSSSTISMKQALQGLGVRAMFTTGADTLDMLEHDGSGSGEPLFVEDVLHRAVVEVDEECIEVAAPDACIMCGAQLWPERQPGHVDFVADHPFAFFVVEEVSGTILLAGHVLDPLQGQ